MPPKPLRLVANSTLCQVEKLSSWVQPCQAGRERALVAAGLELGGGQRDFGPGRAAASSGSRPAALKASLLIVEDRRRAVEREAQHLAVRRRVVAGHGRAHRPRGRTCSRRSSSPGRPARSRPCSPSWWRCRPRTPAGCAARCPRGTRRSPPSSTRRSVPLNVGHDLVVLLARIEVLGQVVDPFVVARPLIECHHWISVWARAGKATRVASVAAASSACLDFMTSP